MQEVSFKIFTLKLQEAGPFKERVGSEFRQYFPLLNLTTLKIIYLSKIKVRR